MEFLSGLWAQYGILIIAAAFVLVIKYAIPFMRKAVNKWLLDRKMSWLLPLADGAFDLAEAVITASGMSNAKRALAIGDIAEKIGHLPKGKELEVLDARWAENAEADRKPLGSLQLNPNGGQSLGGSKFGPQP